MTVTLTKDGSENQTDATQHEVIVKETESETDNKLTTSNKIVIDPAVERDLRRWEAIVTLNEFYKENPQYKNDSSIIDAEDTDESSSASVAPEADGWEPEANRKRRKRNTKVIPTNSGQLAVQTVSLKKRVPRVRRHICHLCGDDFEMQSNFTKHMKAKHPNDLFQCEYCDKTMESSNGLFKHQRFHLYLKHVCEVCKRRFQFPGQKSRHMKIHTQKDLFPCLHCPKKYTTVVCWNTPRPTQLHFSVNYVQNPPKNVTTTSILLHSIPKGCMGVAGLFHAMITSSGRADTAGICLHVRSVSKSRNNRKKNVTTSLSLQWKTVRTMPKCLRSMLYCSNVNPCFTWYLCFTKYFS